MSEFHELSAIQRDMLIVIKALDEPSGLEVGDELKDRHETEIYHSQLYSNLDELVGQELVFKTAADGRTNAYHLTDPGRDVLVEWRSWVREMMP